ncbi:MAG: TIR domain-containing protein, partial [Candidatus Didemnitutus sp.]|nr:TIR domain-containing protein [Candidatus Didemnitutus sp.]
MSDATKAVFLSYASQDAEAAKRIANALRAAGVEVWFDQSELVGGDAWDQKIRGQIGSCALFVPIISAATQARSEGYFRLEWRIAAQRTHMMSERSAFLLPVVIDATRDGGADVPPEFRAVQWTRLLGGETPEKFCARVGMLLGGSESVGAALRRDPAKPSGHKAPPAKSPRSWLVPAVLALAAVAVGSYFWLGRSAPVATPSPITNSPAPLASSLSPATVPAVAGKSVAVLAFANLSDDKDNEYFSDGISEELLNVLAKVPGLKVTARTSAFHFKGKDTPIPEVARQLGVAYVIEGSVR